MNQRIALLGLFLTHGAWAQQATTEASQDKTSSATTSTAPATPAANTEGKKEPKKEEVDRVALQRGAQIPDGKWFWNTSLEHTVGQGTFVNPNYFAFVGATLSVSPSVTFSVKRINFRAFAEGSLSWEYTAPDVAPEAPMAASVNGRRIGFADWRVGVVAPSVYKNKLTGIFVTPSLSATLPLSWASQRSGTITNLAFNLPLNRVFGKLWVQYAFNMGRGLHTTPMLQVNNTTLRDEQGNLLLACRQDQALCATGMTNMEWTISNRIGGAYQATDNFSFGALLGVTNGFRYTLVPEVDEFTPKAVDSNGNPVAAVGPGRVDFISSSIFMTYFLNQIFSLNVSMNTFGTPFTRDNKTLRFPFYDFFSGADSLTSYSVGLSMLL